METEPYSKLVMLVNPKKPLQSWPRFEVQLSDYPNLWCRIYVVCEITWNSSYIKNYIIMHIFWKNILIDTRQQLQPSLSPIDVAIRKDAYV